MRNRLPISTILSTVLLTLAAAPAAAAPEGAVDSMRVEQLHAEGTALYRAGKYAPALAKFQQAFAAFPDPNLGYNIARCQEGLGEIDTAIAGYERTALDPSAGPDLQQKAKSRAAMLRKAKLEANLSAIEDTGLASMPAIGAAPQAQPASTAAGARPAAAPSPAPQPAVTAAAPPAEGGSSLGVVTYALAGVGAAAVITGGIIAGLGQADHGKVEDAKANAGDGNASLTRLEAADLIDSGDSKKSLGTIVLGGGAACLLTAGILFLLDSGSSEPASPAVGVSVGPTGGFVWFGGELPIQ